MHDDRRMFLRAELKRLQSRRARAERRAWRTIWFGSVLAWGLLCWWVYIYMA